jgi:hypothetical protein
MSDCATSAPRNIPRAHALATLMCCASDGFAGLICNAELNQFFSADRKKGASA